MHVPTRPLTTESACAEQRFKPSAMTDQHPDRPEHGRSRRTRRSRVLTVRWGLQNPQLPCSRGSMRQESFWLASRGVDPPMHCLLVAGCGGAHCRPTMFSMHVGAICRVVDAGSRVFAMSCACCASLESALHCYSCCRTTQCMMVQAPSLHCCKNGIRGVK